MAAQHGVCVHVVRVVGRPRHVVSGHQHLVEVLLRAHQRVQVVQLRERAHAKATVKVAVDRGLQDADRVVRLRVQLRPELAEDGVGHVVGGVARDDSWQGQREGREASAFGQ